MQFLAKKYDSATFPTFPKAKKFWESSKSLNNNMLQKKIKNAFPRVWESSKVNKINKLQTKNLRCAISCIYNTSIL